MKKIFLIAILALVAQLSFAQAPQKMSYQSVVRSATNQIIANQSIGVKISIIESSLNGTTVYAERHTTTTNANGLFTLEAGGGTPTTGTFATINWANGSHYIKSEIDVTGGTNYTLSGTMELLSVPYALYATNGISPAQATAITTQTANNTAMQAQIASQAVTITSQAATINAMQAQISVLQQPQLTVAQADIITAMQAQLSVLQKPRLITFQIENLTSASATSGGAITSIGLGGITATGLVWSTLANPTIDLTTKTFDGIGSHEFTINITGLTPETTYYVRAYATNSYGTAYGNEVIFTTLPTPVTLAEVTIGTQTWTGKNLDAATYSDGTVIPQVTDPTQWANLTTGAWCYYNNDSANGAVYGKLYNWYAVAGIHNEASKTDASQRKKLAPTGYHVPSDAEWTTLTDYLGGAGVAGGKMKESGTTHWNSPNGDASNSSGFTGLPGGYRYNDGSFYDIGLYGYWWSSSVYNTADAWDRGLNYDDGIANRSLNDKTNGWSVRCLRD